MVDLADRRVAFDGKGRLCAAQGDQISVAADQLYAVVVLWDADEGSSWVGGSPRPPIAPCASRRQTLQTRRFGVGWTSCRRATLGHLERGVRI